ncbi:proline--tRNA ligase [Paludibaculum fermentans]|uniref:Proline--tRNA ligase n=1 Tax=Paludibaculum fermentans TaxID=1473598 RepID=A0A7S7NVS3_PALFE|nr:proline--tRNA ligase [Paludibaculum fermentans]QOY90722.1 proline--tRNA ligase [Paludibaculum fermentans]
MLWSKLFIPTLRESPAEAEVVSHQLLLRAGYIRQLGAGIYNYLYLAQRSLLKIQRIVREEMDAIGAQEFLLPALNPAEVWQESGRYEAMGDNMFRLKDRFGRQLCLGMTHEEVMTVIARGEVRSYKQLPQIWYQIQTKFRDEPRPKSGLLRVRQFIMKDSYSFDLAPAGLDESYEKHRLAYCRIFDRCGLQYVAVEAHSGAMGGSQSQEFMVATDAGEDYVVVCKETGYAANLEKAVSRPVPPAAPDAEGDLSPEEVHTPGQKSIDEVSAFLKVPATSIIKSLVLIADGKPVVALMRGDHQLSETKFQSATGCAEFRPAFPEEMRTLMGAEAGSLGPVGLTGVTVIADLSLQGRRNMVAGANKDDYHLLNVTPGEDFAAVYHDLRQVTEGDTELETGAPLQILKTMEIGHIFKLGYKYSHSMGLNVLDQNGVETPVIMGSYGIGIERVLCGVVELYADANGISMPVSIAPFEAVVTPVKSADPALAAAGQQVYEELKKLGVDVLYDDRELSPGVKFKDADLVGIPYRVVIGKKLPQGIVELAERRTGAKSEVPLAEVAGMVAEKVRAAKQ